MRPFIILVVLCACAPADAYADAEPSCDGAPFDARALAADVAQLASPALAGRAPGTHGDRAARAFIVQRFACLGVAATEQAVGDTANVIAVIPGDDPDQIVVVGAHHDHLGDHHLGANDNASGVVAMLAIAKAVARRDARPHRTLAFIAWADEERGEVGSHYFVAHPPDTLPLDHVVEYINLDMVGSYASRGWVAAMGAFRGQPARTLLDQIAHPGLDVVAGGRAERSDHEPFCKLGVPYVFFWTPDDRCYHETCDTSDKLDGKHMARIAELAGALTLALADTDIDLAAARARSGCAAPRVTGSRARGSR